VSPLEARLVVKRKLLWGTGGEKVSHINVKREGNSVEKGLLHMNKRRGSDKVRCL